MFEDEPFLSRLNRWARARAHHPMIVSPGITVLDGSGLLELIERTHNCLIRLGFRSGHRIVSTLGRGADAAAAALTIGSYCSYVPLNPEHTRDQWVSAFRSIRPAALLVREDGHPLATQVARDAGVPILMLSALRIHLEEARPLPTENALRGERFLLETSGTVRPKYVPKTGAGICASLEQICAAIPFEPEDRCAVMVPAFHSLGLISTIVLPALTGGCAIHSQGPAGFFDACENQGVTWFAAAPAVLQDLTKFAYERDLRLKRPLRLIRTAGATLNPGLATAARDLFGCPVLSTYGSTEAPFISIVRPDDPSAIDHCGRPCPGVSIRIDAIEDAALGLGEIVVKAASTATEYWNDPESTREAFETDSAGRIWYRTGDLGRLDHHGNLHPLGRKTDIINRGGLKVSPWEVEAALVKHPAVAEAVAFKIPDARLGEEVAAVVTLRSGQPQPTALELRGFASRQLTLAKTPRRIFLVEEIPRNEMGKPLRAKLTEQFAGQRLERPIRQEPSDEFEAALLRIAANVLCVAGIGGNDNFFDLGGNSSSGLEFLCRLSEHFSLGPLDPSLLFEANSFSGLAVLLRFGGPQSGITPPSVVALHPDLNTDGIPLVIVCADPAAYAHPWRTLDLPPGQPVYLLKPPRLEGINFQHTAHLLVTALQEVLPHGPYALAGTCLMGSLAQEMAVQLEQSAEQVCAVFVVHAWFPYANRSLRMRHYFDHNRIRGVWREAGSITEFLRRGAASIGMRVQIALNRIRRTAPALRSPLDLDIEAAMAACRAHVVRPASARVVTIWSSHVEAILGHTPQALWGGAAERDLVVERLTCNRQSLLAGERNHQLAEIVERHLRQVSDHEYHNRPLRPIIEHLEHANAILIS